MSAIRRSLRALSPTSQRSPLAKKSRKAEQLTPILPKADRLESINRLLHGNRCKSFFSNDYISEKFKPENNSRGSGPLTGAVLSLTNSFKICGESSDTQGIRVNAEQSPIVGISKIIPAINVTSSTTAYDSKVDSCSGDTSTKFDVNFLRPETTSVGDSFLSPPTLQSISPGVHSPQCCQLSPSGPLYTPNRQETFLGRGSFGKVVLCRQKNFQFALKIIPRKQSSKINEKNCLGIKHKHIVRILKICEEFDKVYIYMEFAGHSNLQSLLYSKSHIPFKKKLSFSRQVTSALSYCHNNHIIHGDVKPANIIISPNGICKLGDFGLSVKKSSHGLYPLLSKMGTAAYTAPEILKGELPTSAVDIYSLGIVFWQLYTEEVPFGGEHPHVIIYKVVSKNVRPELTESKDFTMIQYMLIIKECWHKEPQERLTPKIVLTKLQKLQMQFI